MMSLTSVAPTVMSQDCRPGEYSQASLPSLPAATTNVKPAEKSSRKENRMLLHCSEHSMVVLNDPRLKTGRSLFSLMMWVRNGFPAQ